MTSYNINIAPDVRQAFPSLRIFMLRAGILTRTNTHIDVSDHAKRAVDSLTVRNIKIEHLAEVEPFRSWRELFAKMGLKSSSFRSSVEALTRRMLRNGKLPMTGVC